MAAVPALLVPDNHKSTIHRACRYEPQANSTYQDLGAAQSIESIAVTAALKAWPPSTEVL